MVILKLAAVSIQNNSSLFLYFTLKYPQLEYILQYQLDESKPQSKDLRVGTQQLIWQPLRNRNPEVDHSCYIPQRLESKKKKKSVKKKNHFFKIVITKIIETQCGIWCNFVCKKKNPSNQRILHLLYTFFKWGKISILFEF